MRRPRVKPEHLPYRLNEDTVRIGGGIYGTAAEIKDPRGWVWAALELFDGKNSPAEIVEGLRHRFPEMSAAVATGMVDQLVRSGYVEDAATEAPAELSDAEIERYSRNHVFFRRVDLQPRTSTWHAQVALKKARVVIVGLGGTGSQVAWSLTAAGVGQLHFVDHDLVELTNLNRQMLYTEPDIGRPKVEVAAERLRCVNSASTITVERRMVDTQEELAELAAGFDVLVLCADESRHGSIRTLASRACASAGVPWVGGGYSGPLTTVGVFAPGGPCFECVAAGEEARLAPGEPAPLIGGGVIAPSAAICGQLMAYETISLITGVAQQPPGYVRGINLIAHDELVYVRHSARSDCDVCNPVAVH